MPAHPLDTLPQENVRGVLDRPLRFLVLRPSAQDAQQMDNARAHPERQRVSTEGAGHTNLVESASDRRNPRLGATSSAGAL